MAESRGNPAILRISLVLDLERVLMRAVGVVSIREMRKLGTVSGYSERDRGPYRRRP